MNTETQTTETKQLDSSFIGSSLSHGTMRDQDLYEAFIGFLEDHDLDTAARIKEEYANCIDEEGYLFDSYDHPELADDISFLINEGLFDALNNIAPEGSYFGSHPGDGADYGFWQFEEDYLEEEDYDPYWTLETEE